MTGPVADEYFSLEVRDALIEAAGEAHAQAVKCADTGAFWAACVMGGVAAEAILLDTIAVFEPELRQANIFVETGRGPLWWHLGQLIDVALTVGWISPTDPRGALELSKPQLNEVRNVRNLVHPGALVRAGVQPDAERFRRLHCALDDLFDMGLRLLRESDGKPPRLSA